MIKEKNIAIVGVDPYNGNRGVGALAYSTLFLLANIADKNNFKLNIYFIVESVSKSSDTFVIGDTSTKVSFIPQINLFRLKGVLKAFLKPKVLWKYLDLDHILDIGAGDSFSDIYGENRFNTINNPKRLFRLLSKKQLLLPQTIGPFDNPKIKKQANWSIEKSSFVLTRDLKSFKYVKNNTNQKNVQDSIDVAFFMPYKKKHFPNNYIQIGLSVSALLWHGGYNKKNQFGLKTDYQDTVKKVIDFFISQDGVKIHLVPHVVSINSTIENDYEVSQLLVEYYKNDKIQLAPLFLNPIEAKNYISGLDFFVGSRMHACIAAFSAFVPVYPLAYSRKFNGLFVDTLSYEFMGDLLDQEQTNILDELKKSFKNRHELKIIIEDRMGGIVANRSKLLMRIIEEFLLTS